MADDCVVAADPCASNKRSERTVSGQNHYPEGDVPRRRPRLSDTDTTTTTRDWPNRGTASGEWYRDWSHRGTTRAAWQAKAEADARGRDYYSDQRLHYGVRYNKHPRGGRRSEHAGHCGSKGGPPAAHRRDQPSARASSRHARRLVGERIAWYLALAADRHEAYGDLITREEGRLKIGRAANGNSREWGRTGGWDGAAWQLDRVHDNCPRPNGPRSNIRRPWRPSVVVTLPADLAPGIDRRCELDGLAYTRRVAASNQLNAEAVRAEIARLATDEGWAKEPAWRANIEAHLAGANGVTTR